jgi:hypothetical protein
MGPDERLRHSAFLRLFSDKEARRSEERTDVNDIRSSQLEKKEAE